MLSSKTCIEGILQIAPEWGAVLESLSSSKEAQSGTLGAVTPLELFQRLGATAIYRKTQALTDKQDDFVNLVRDFYLQPLLTRMVSSNQHLRRFASQRRIPADEVRRQAISFAGELAEKLEAALRKQLAQGAEDGFKVLLPAYGQRSVHNGVIDFIRQEWEWERSTLHDLNLDPEQEDPRQNTADDLVYIPENQAISNEQVKQLNQLRSMLQGMLGNDRLPQEPLQVLDCLFGLGLTRHSKAGTELTMRECCDILKIQGETQARKIARCQVFLDKGLALVREAIRETMPGIAASWQSETNVNRASRRELNQQLGMTENEVERLIVSRQYRMLMHLVERAVLKPPRLKEIEERGAVAAFVPVDVNSATNRDLMDILGVKKELAAKIVATRPFDNLKQLADRGLLDNKTLSLILNRGAVLKARSHRKADLNSAQQDEIVSLGFEAGLAARLIRGRPYGTWSELAEYLGLEEVTVDLLKQKFSLGVLPV